MGSAVLAVAALAARALGSAAPSKSGAPAVRVAIVTDIGGLNDRASTSCRTSGSARDQDAGGSGPRVRHQLGERRTSNLRTAARSGFRLVFPIGVLFAFGPIDAVAPSSRTRSSRASTSSGPISKRSRPTSAGPVPGAGGRLSRRLHRRSPVKDQPGRDVISAVGANRFPRSSGSSPATGPAPCGRAPAQQRPGQLRPDPTFADQAKCKETTLNQIDAARGSRSWSPAPAASAVSRPPRSGGSGASGWTPTSTSSAAHPHERDEEGQRGRLRHDQGLQGEPFGVPRRQQHDVQRQEQRRGSAGSA